MPTELIWLITALSILAFAVGIAGGVLFLFWFFYGPGLRMTVEYELTHQKDSDA